MTITWEDPPNPNSWKPRVEPRLKRTDPRHDELRANPGRWGVWCDAASSKTAQQLAYYLKKAHGYETASRGVRVYVLRRPR